MRRLNLLYLAGLVVVAFCLMAKPTPSFAVNYGDYLSTITVPSPNEPLNQPAKVAVDQANGDVYVTDSGNKKVKKFDKNGNYVAAFSLAVAGTPVGIAVNANNIFVGDDTNDCVWVYDKNGALADLAGTGTSHKLGGASGTAVKMPNTVAVAPSGHIFVADGDNDKVLIYNADGTYNSSFGTSGSGLSTGTTIYCYYPSGIAIGANSPDTPAAGQTTQYLYVGDQGNYRVQKLHYVYDSSTKAIVTAPTFDLNVGSGTRADAFGSFLRLSDVVCDNTGRLIALDSLSMVGQIFQSDNLYTSATNPCKDVNNNVAINYCTSAVVGNLNVPTGAAVYMGDASTTPRLYVANNQDNNIVVYNTQDGAIPTLQITDPTIAVVPCTATYTVKFSGTDADSTTETVKLYYYNTANSSIKTLFSTQAVTVTAGAFSGTATLDLVGTYPNYLTAGTYGIYGEVTDEKSNLGTADSGTGTIGITNVANEGNYTCSMAAKWGDGLTTDTDGDGLSNAAEINGTDNTAFANAPTDPTNADTDGDGLDDGVEEGVVAVNSNVSTPISYSGPLVDANGKLINHSNPNAKDTDGGGVSDAVEVAKGTDPTSALDDINSTQDGYLAYFHDGATTPWTSRVFVNNISGSTVVADLTFLNTNGTVIGSAKALKLAPHQSTYIWPSTYGVTEGAIESRATVAGSIRAGYETFRTDVYNPQKYESGWCVNFTGEANDPTNGSNHFYGDTYCDDPATGWRFVNYFFLFNPNNSAITVTGNWYNNGAIAMAATATVAATNNYVIPAHGYIIIRPSVEVPSQQWGYVDFTSTNTFNGYQGRERFNATDPAIYDIGFGFNLDSVLKTTTYLDTFCDSMWNFVNYIYFLNPGNTASTITINYYDTLGNSVATKQYTIQPNGVQGQRVLTDLGQTLINSIQWGSATITATGGGVVGFQQRYRNNATNSSLFDYGYSWRMGVPSTDYLYLPYYEDNVDNYVNYLYIRNDSAVAANITIQFYDTLGNPAGTDTPTIQPNTVYGYRPYTKGPTKGSAVITVQSGSVTAYMLGQRMDQSGSGLIDYGFGLEMTR